MRFNNLANFVLQMRLIRFLYIQFYQNSTMAFIHLPDQNQLRQTTSYHKIFALTLFWNVGLLGLIFLFFFIISFVLKTYQLKTKKNLKLRIRESLLSQQSRQQSQRISERQLEVIETEKLLEEEASPVENPSTKRFKVCNFLASLFFYLFWLDVSLVYLVFYMFGYMGRGVSHDILTVFIMVLIVVIPTLVWKNSTKVSEYKFIKKELVFTVICLLIWLGACIFGVISLKGACLCYYNDNYGFSVGNNMGPFLSTQWTRTNAIEKVCKDEQICNLYATVPLNASSDVFINIHTGLGLENLTVKMYNNEIQNFASRNITYYYNLKNVEDIGKRLVHTAYFNSLKPGITYVLQIYKRPQGNETYGAPLKNTTYKTTPDRFTKELRMAVGGDVSMTQEGKKITSNLYDFNPDIIIIGGDNAYDDGMRTCWYSWDNFYSLFDDLNNKLGRLVPIVMSVGNHDVGYDAMATVSTSLEEEQVPLYFLYNPQHLDYRNSIPNLVNRSTIHTHVIGPTVHLHLDSGYIVPFKAQKDLIKQTGQDYGGYYRFANYHNPIYPSCTDMNQGSNDLNVIGNATEFWTPMFDQYNYTACFEHHTHHKKFTKKIKGGQVSSDESGTRYVGDGSWGVVEGACPDNKISPAEKFEFYDPADPNHVWLITLNREAKQYRYSINYTAINLWGVVTNNETRIDLLPVLG